MSSGCLPVPPSPGGGWATIGGGLKPDELGGRLADDRGGLEAVRPPAGADVEVLDLGLAEDGAVIGAQVAQAGPGAQQARVLQLREELERVARDLLQEVERPVHPVRRPRLDLGAHEELA